MTDTVNFIGNTMERKIIYVYRKNYDVEKDYLKIGDASIDKPNANMEDNSKYLREVAEKRIRNYERTSPITILYCTLAVKNNWEYFRDYQVHEVLERSGYKKIRKGESTEWFKIDIETAKRAIMVVKEGNNSINFSNSDNKQHGLNYRPEQSNAIKQTLSIFKNKNDMLWNAKMRFGKTCCALEVIKQKEFKKTLILTHRPIVDNEWYDNFKKVFYEKHTIYRYSSNRFGEKKSIIFAQNFLNPFVYFTSIQDLRESRLAGGNYDKNDEVFETHWDFIIIDEAHEGMQTGLAETVLNLVIRDNTKVLKLSGTPFNLMHDYDESQIYTWDYVMEQEAKYNWDTEHPGDYNPYSGLPKMKMFVYELGNYIKDKTFIDIENKAFNFAEFFKVENDKFIYQEEVWRFLNLISKSEDFSSSTTNMPFSTINYRNELRHTLWTMPSRKAGQVLEGLLKKHPVFSNYNIANLVDDGDSTNDIEKIKAAITDSPENTYSITLTVRKGTVGITVKEWSGVLVLNNTESASNYLQTIFRVQSPYTGKIGIKEIAYVFDFAPDRTLKMVAEAAKLNIKAGSLNSKTQENQVSKLLNFLPIIGIEGNVMKSYSVKSMLTQLKRANAVIAVSKGFDDSSIYSDELYRLSDKDLVEFERLYSIVGKTQQTKSINEVPVNGQGLNDEEWEKAERGSKKNKNNRTPEEQEALEKRNQLTKQRQSLISILRGISIRIPLMIYGMDLTIHDDVTIEEFIDKVDDISWEEFMPQGVTKDDFKKIKKYYDSDVFVEAGRRIRRSALAADNLSYEEKIEKITSLFSQFKNPDKETVLTPWRIVNMHLGRTIGGYNFFGEDYPEKPDTELIPQYIDYGNITKKAFNPKVKVLEINSKSGLYPLYMTYSIYKNRFNDESTRWSRNEWLYNDRKLWKDVLENNIYVLCKTPMAKTITYRTLNGYEKNEKINANLVYIEDLISKIKTNCKCTLNEIKNKFGGSNMKFDIIVGNPPYQETVKAATTGNNANTVDIFQHFQKLALSLGDVNSLIYPAKELQRGKMDLMDERLLKVRIYNGSNKETEKNIPGEPSVFGDAVRRITGDVGIFLWDNVHTSKKINYQGVDIDRTDKIMPLRKEFFSLAKHLEQYAGRFEIGTIKKCCESNFVVKNKSSVLSLVLDRSQATPNGYTKVLTNNKAGSGGKAMWYYIKTSALDYIQPNVYKVVIGSAFPNEGFKNPKNIEVLGPDEMFGRTKMSLYTSDNKTDAINFKKFTSTKFVRNIVEMTPLKFLYYLPDFNAIKDDIDWGKTIDEIDDQLNQLFDV